MKVFSVKKTVLLFLLFGYLKSYCQMQSGEVFMLSNFMEVGISECGAFGTKKDIAGSHSRPGSVSNLFLGFVADPDKDGWANGATNYYGDFFVPGSPVEGWAIQLGNGASMSNQNGTGCFISGANASYSHNNSIQSAVWKSDATFKTNTGLEICQAVSFKDGDIAFVVNVNITNSSNSVIKELYYMRNVDPDNDVIQSGDYTTFNTIVQQGGNAGNSGAVVTARGTHLTNAFLGLGSLNPNARVAVKNTNIQPNSNLQTIWNGADPDYSYNLNYTSSADVNICLIFKHTNIQPGQTIKFSYAYVLDLASLNSALQTTTSAISILANNQDITANPQVTIQPGGSVNLSIVSDPGFVWQWSPSSGLSGTTGNTQTASPSLTTQYTVTGTLKSGCEDRTEVLHITVVVSNCESPCEKIEFYFPERICVNEKIKFETAFAGCTTLPNFVWDFGGGGPVSTIPEYIYAYPGQYIVKLIIPASGNCPEKTISRTLIVEQCPEFDCNDHHDEDPTHVDPCELTATINLEGVIKPTSEIIVHANPNGGSGNYTYNWSVTGPGVPAPVIASGQGTPQVHVKFNTSGHIFITVVITDDKGCKTTKTFDYFANS